MNTATRRKRIAQGRPPDRGEDRRAAILDSALTLFAGQGIAGTTIAQIARAAGVTPAMVHYYFGNQEGLLDTLVSERLAPCVAFIWDGISEETLTDPARIVMEFVDRLLETVDNMPQLPLLWNREILNTGGLLRERIMPLIPQDRFEAVVRAIATGQKKGRLNADLVAGLMPSSIIAVVMLPLAAQTFLHQIPAVPPLDRETIRRHAQALLLHGLRPEDSTGEQA